MVTQYLTQYEKLVIIVVTITILFPKVKHLPYVVPTLNFYVRMYRVAYYSQYLPICRKLTYLPTCVCASLPIKKISCLSKYFRQGAITYILLRYGGHLPFTYLPTPASAYKQDVAKILCIGKYCTERFDCVRRQVPIGTHRAIKLRMKLPSSPNLLTLGYNLSVF